MLSRCDGRLWEQKLLTRLSGQLFGEREEEEGQGGDGGGGEFGWEQDFGVGAGRKEEEEGGAISVPNNK